MHAVSILQPGRPPERRDIAAAVRAGGSQADHLHLPGWAPSALRLFPVAAGVVVEAAVPGVRVAGRPVAPGARRLLRGGERAELHGAAILLEPPVEGATRAAAAAVLRLAAAGDGAIAGAHLVVLTGPAAGARHALGAEQTLGRGRAATIVLPDPHASRVHAAIGTGPAGVWIEDLGSKNGVRVNGVRIDRRPWPLRAGDELVVGETAVAVQDLEAPRDRAGSARGSPAPRPRRRLFVAALLTLSAVALALAAA